MTPAPITAHMSNFDPIPRLQQIAATIEDGGHFDSPATAAHYITCAIKEIERLRKERDEARRVAAYQYAKHSNYGDESFAMRNFFQFHKWEHLKEDGK